MRKENKYFLFGLDLDISVFSNLKEGINKINDQHGTIILILNNGKLSFQFEEKIVKESREVIVIEDDNIEEVNENLSEDEMESSKIDKNSSTITTENISFGSSDVSGVIERPSFIVDDYNEEIEPINQVLSDDEEEMVDLNEEITSVVNIVSEKSTSEKKNIFFDNSPEETQEILNDSDLEHFGRSYVPYENISSNQDKDEDYVDEALSLYENNDSTIEEEDNESYKNLEMVQEKLSDEDENELNQLIDYNLFNQYNESVDKIEEIKESLSSDDEENEEFKNKKYFVKKLTDMVEINQEKNNTGYYLLFGLEEKSLFDSFKFKKDEFEPKNGFIIEPYKTSVNFSKDWLIVLYGNICLNKHSNNGLYLNDKYSFYKNENTNPLLNLPISCDPNCVIDFIENNNKKYFCLRTTKDIKSGDYLRLESNKKMKYCLDFHEGKEYNCKITLSDYKSKYIINFLKECKNMKDLGILDVKEPSFLDQKKKLSEEEFESSILFSKSLGAISFLIQCSVINNALGISHGVFHRKYCGSDKRFKRKSQENYISCFPCILKLKEFFNITIDSGFKDVKSYIEYLVELENERQDHKESKKTNKKKKRLGKCLVPPWQNLKN